MSETLRFTIVIPAKDEAENLPAVVEEITNLLAGESFEIFIVDDGSTDGTPLVLQQLSRAHHVLRHAAHARSRGKSAAIMTGTRAACAPVVVTIDGDGQNDPRHLLALVALAEAPGVGLAAGQRVTHAHPAAKRFASRFANWVRSRLLQDQTRDTACGLKAFRREVFLALPYFASMHRFLPVLVMRAGLAVRHLDVFDRPRLHGKSKYGLIDRAAVGVVDLARVWWLTRRRGASMVSKIHPAARADSTEVAGSSQPN
ncbi:MAG: dolichol-phosphate mannosyltransferase [Chthoniobacter sp.]|nr:dolichol-phosphate mannosyltransferase [Chthoniobacter sp.]